MTRLGITMDYSDDFATVAADVVEFERVGADVVEVAEAYSFDAVSRLGYLAAITAARRCSVRRTDQLTRATRSHRCACRRGFDRRC